jgi:hypothetical protein
MVTFAVPKTDADVLAEVLAAGEVTFKPDIARWLLNLAFTEPQQARVVELVEKGNRGTLTTDEHEELHRYLRIGSILNILGAKARLALRDSARSD